VQPCKVFWYLGHTHWEGAVFKTRAAYLDMGLPNILRALRLMQVDPSYRFALDQACYVQPFLERYPAEEPLFRQMIAERRLEIVGGTDVMPDVNMPSGESFVRQIVYGKRYFRQKLGVDVTVGWQLDTFGHNEQIPQIMRLGGYGSFWFFRGVANWDVPNEFQWQGLDGTRLPALWLSEGYAVGWGSPKELPAFADFMYKRCACLDRQAHHTHRAAPAGADVCEPEEWVPALVAQFNQLADRKIDVRIGIPSDYERAISAPEGWPVVTGELNPIFQGAYSSRIELKLEQRDLERLLTTAEKLGALAQSLGAPCDMAQIWRAWEPVLFNQTHDLASGVMTDGVYHDTVKSYGFSRRLVEEQVESSQRSLAERIDTRSGGSALPGSIPVVVWNTLGWPRTDVVEVEVGLTKPGVRSLSVVDAATSRVLPCQLSEAEWHADGGLLRAKLVFVARDVPAMGHAVYQIVPIEEARAYPTPICATLAGDLATLQNDHYRLTANVRTGAITSLVIKPGKWEALAGEANVITRQEDRGDFWELYRSLDGASRIAMTNQQPVPKAGDAAFSNQEPGEPGVVTSGPVFCELAVKHGFGEGEFATRIRLYAGLERVEVRTTLVNKAKFVRYQALFPTNIKGGRNVHEIPFGAIERPLGIEFPAQNWVDYGDGQHGVALLNRGTPGNVTSEDTLMLSLLRSNCIVAYGFGGGYEPGMSSDTGFELDTPRTFDYALVPHTGGWAEAKVYQSGLAYNNPLLAHTAVPHAGLLPARWGWLQTSAPNLVISAVTPGQAGGVVVRVYEATGQAVSGARLSVNAHVLSAQEVNLLEDPIAPLAVEQDAVVFDMRPFEIKTVAIILAN